MARDSNGTYTPPAGQPVVTGTTISSATFNTLVDDLGDELTDSASRSGKGGFTAPVRGANGTVTAPTFSFTNDTGVGIYRSASGTGALAAGGNAVLTWDSAGVYTSAPSRTALTLASGWSNGTPAPRYYKAFGRVWLEGSVSVPINGSRVSTNDGSMPAGFRPVGDVCYILSPASSNPITSYAGDYMRLVVTSAGVVRFETAVVASATVVFALDGISWVADN